MTDALQRLRELMHEHMDLDHVASVLVWDQRTYMPEAGAEARSHQLALVSRLAHERLISDEMGEAIEAAREAVAGMDPDSDEARLVRVAARRYEKLRRVPAEYVQERMRLATLGGQAWEQARAKSDFGYFAPYLKQIVDLVREYPGFFEPAEHPYDRLIEDYDPGMTTAQVRQVFDALRQEQVALVRRIVEAGPVDDSFLNQHYDPDRQLALTVEALKAIGYDFRRGRQDLSAHPFTFSFGINDVRITTRVLPERFGSALFSTLHEAGHAFYALGLDPSMERTLLEKELSLTVHESQSRLWENLVGRSLAFWRFFYPRVQQAFPEQLGDVDLETFHRAINKVEPSLIRVEADEATYNLHIMLRFELEVALLEGNLEVDDLPEVWNEKMEEYLGVRPKNDAEGVLQDVHWSESLMGYFPTYALGNLAAAQLWESVTADIPDLDNQIAAGQFDDLHAWLREKVHRHGAKFDTPELLERVTGRPLTAEPYLRYLKTKFGALYGLD